MIFFRMAGSGWLAGCERVFRGLNGADGATQEFVPFLESPALDAQGFGQPSRPLQHRPDLLERDPEKLERDDLLQGLQIAFAIDPVAGFCAARLQESQAIIVVQRFDGYARELGELVNFVVPAQIRPFFRNAKV